jgi:2'-5' RNA ligase
MIALSNILRRIAKSGVSYSSYSTQVDLPGTLAERVLGWSQIIPEIELYNNEENEYGKENDAHITVLYGIKDEDPKIKSIIQSFKPFDIRLGIVTAFRDSKDYDVLKVGIESPVLHKMHYMLEANIKNKNSFPTYAPHMTLAYLKKSFVDKYIGDQSFQGTMFLNNVVMFCLKDSRKVPIILG